MLLFYLINACTNKNDYYTNEDFEKTPKTDIHLHIESSDSKYMEFATRYNFRVVSPNVDAGTSLDYQLETASEIKSKWPNKFAFLGTFSVDDYGDSEFAENIINRINLCLAEGASGIKIWKNIGMTLKDSSNQYVMVDNPEFDPVFKHLEENKIPLMGHLGEPLNCWLPLEEMTDAGNYQYFKSHPEYHMYLHPEAPSYEDQINARDNLLEKFPELIFTGAHIGSLEWSVDEIAKRLDRFPNMNIDLSARMAHLQYQSISNYDKVRDFMLKYQDRIIYGSDITIKENETNPDAIIQRILDRWQSNWTYLATDLTQDIDNMQKPIKGLKLPKEVIDKIYYSNADYYFE